MFIALEREGVFFGFIISRREEERGALDLISFGASFLTNLLYSLTFCGDETIRDI